jgi:hypothetical protein
MQRNESVPADSGSAETAERLHELADEQLECVVGGLARAYETPDPEIVVGGVDGRR